MGEELKPSALSAAGFELVMFRLAALSVFSVTTPPLTVDGVEVPVIELILLRRLPTFAVARSIGGVERVAGAVGGVVRNYRLDRLAIDVERGRLAEKELVSDPTRRTGQARRTSDRRTGLAIDDASGGRSGWIEEIVARGNRGSRHQRRIDYRADCRIQRRVQVAGGRCRS